MERVSEVPNVCGKPGAGLPLASRIHADLSAAIAISSFFV